MLGSSPRRSFVGRLAAGAAAVGAAIATGSTPLQAMSASPDFKPAKHPQDDWFDTLPGKHRIFFDAVSAHGAGGALGFANNFAVANKNGYSLAATDVARVICYRHFATVFAFTDPMWAKYGAIWGALLDFKDPATNAAPVRNVWNATDLTGMQPNLGNTVSAMVKDGVHFAVCDMATHFIAGATADKAKLNAGAVYDELKANACGNAHFVPAGIVAVNRAQERGYSYAYVG
jgi:intracellular sulfur oxidation DsrE/DsrF family protein